MKSLSRGKPIHAPLCFGGGGVELSNPDRPLVYARVLLGLNRPICQSLTRALRHIIEFYSGLLIKSSDLQPRPEP